MKKNYGASEVGVTIIATVRARAGERTTYVKGGAVRVNCFNRLGEIIEKRTA